MTTTTTTTRTLDAAVQAMLGDADEFSPYSLRKVVNDLLAEFGAEKEIPSQMVYNYVNNKLIKGVTRRMVSTKKGTREAVFVSREGATEWITKYVSKNLPK
jgi:hypothetical protein